jgi:uncharacterized surface protein with fasciclin (FAS1) repeats
MSATTTSSNIVEIASADPDFSTLVTAVKAAGLIETLAGANRFTVFAPTNQGFAALPAGTIESLMKPENRKQLSAILTYHVVPGVLWSKEVKSGDVTTVNGARLTVSVDGPSVTITDGRGGKARVTQADIAASNGVIHVIDRVLLPN